MQHIPKNWGQLFVLATKIYLGLIALAASIPVTMVTAAQMLTSKTAFKNAGDAFNTARRQLNDAYKVSNPAQEALHAWLVKVRTILAGPLGKDWSADWAEAGWVNHTTAVPDTIEGRLALGLLLVTYLTNNPDYEVPNMDVTADKATELTAAASAGQQAVAAKQQALDDAGDAREPAKADLLTLIGRVILNLDGMLTADDPRWRAFGLEMPATKMTPGAPEGLRATIAGNQILLECNATPLATRYRFRSKIVGQDPGYKLVASGQQPMAVLEGIAPGLTLEIIVQAVNGPSQGVASNPILVTMPLTAPVAAKMEAATESGLAPLAAIAPNGNGHGNGNGGHAGSRLS